MLTYKKLENVTVSVKEGSFIVESGSDEATSSIKFDNSSVAQLLGVVKQSSFTQGGGLEFQNRLENTIKNLDNFAENLQAATAMQAQVNQQPQFLYRKVGEGSTARIYHLRQHQLYGDEICRGERVPRSARQPNFIMNWLKI